VKRGAPLGADLVIPALALGFAIYFFFSIADLAWEAKANGVLIGAVLVGLIFILAARTALQLVRGEGNLDTDLLWLPREALGKRLGMVAITIVFIGALPWLGLTLALLLGMFASLWVMGVRNRAALVGLPLAVASAAYLLFIALLHTDFPHGPIERLLS
jgi:hypothetical protein